MSNIHRIRWIDQQIRNKSYPNAIQIADYFEISVRQASRDIEYLRYSLEAPLEYSHENRGYFYQNETFTLPSLFISQDDRDVLFFLAKQYQQIESSQAKRLADLLLQISGESKEKIKPDFSTIDPTLKPALARKYHLLDKAMHDRMKINMKYISEGNQFTERIIHPYQWMQSFGYHYLVAFCEKRKDIRLFRLDRIRKIKVVQEHYIPSPDFQAGSYRFPKRSDRKPYHAVIQWERSVVIPPSFQSKVRILKPMMVEIEFEDSSLLFSELISVLEPFIIIEPIWLKQQFKRFINRFLENNP